MRHQAWAIVIGAMLLLLANAPPSRGLAEELTAETFDNVARLVKPALGESLWRHIDWQTSLNAARRKAAAEGKPLLIWAGGGSAPLGGC